MSGYTDQDKINIALITFKNEQNESFRFQHCWVELRNSPKWKLEGVNGGVRREMWLCIPKQLHRYMSNLELMTLMIHQHLYHKYWSVQKGKSMQSSLCENERAKILKLVHQR